MDNITTEELQTALSLILSTIKNCEKAQAKFKSGTSQHALLKNRLKALAISQALLSQDNVKHYDQQELEQALPPILSIIHKCEKAQQKYPQDHRQYKRYLPLIKAMKISETLIRHELKKQQISE